MWTEQERKDFDILGKRKTGSSLDNYQILELNADYTPLWYCPLSRITWRQAIWLIAKGEETKIPRIHVVEYYEGVFIGTSRKSYQLPSVVAHLSQRPLQLKFSRLNIYVRDGFKCQYTGIKYPPEQLNFDHVIPSDQGGTRDWHNIVTCHREINSLKMNRTPEQAGLKLVKKPRRPNVYELREMGKKYPPRYLDETWEDYLYWNTELEKG